MSRPMPTRWNRALFVFAAAIWLGIVVKAASCAMTWDESWTFLHYTRRWSDLLVLDYANNHPLNSLLIRTGTVLFGTDSELVIRLPNVLAGAAFLLVTLSALPHVRRPRTFFLLAVCQPYLLDYFAIARGYGIAAACVQLGLVAGLFLPPRRWSLAALAAGMAAAGLCIFPVAVASLFLIAALLAMRLAPRLAAPSAAAAVPPRPPLVLSLPLSLPPWRAPGTVFWPVLAAWTAAALLAVAGLKQVSRPGVPVFGSTAGWYRAIPVSVVDKNLGAGFPSWLIPFLLGGAVLLVLAGLRRQSGRTRILLGCSVSSMLAIEAASVLLRQPLPTDRVLIPWYPLWTLALLSVVEDLPPRPARIGREVRPSTPSSSDPSSSNLSSPDLLSAILAGGCAVLLLSALRHIDFHRYEDWPTEAAVPAELAHAILSRRCLPPDITLPHDYYLVRWFGTVTPPGLPRC